MPFSPSGGFVSSIDDLLPLRAGHVGDAVIDLQERLTAFGIAADPDPGGFYGSGTVGAVEEFQRARGLRVDGACDRATWAALVEAGHKLGERLLYRRRPMMRGDDVADLQRRLSEFGFYPGAIDAIFGDRTAAALSEFQRNVGAPPDGVLGRRTFEELERLGSKIGEGELLSSVLERLMPRQRTVLEGALIVVGQEGGFAQGVAAVCRALGSAGAHAVDVHHPDSSRLAAEANAVDAAVYVGLQLDPKSRVCKTDYYSGFRYESIASRTLAELIQTELPATVELEDGGIAGMALPILRETRMPAVLLELGSPAVVIRHTAALGQLLCRALASWMAI